MKSLVRCLFCFVLIGIWPATGNTQTERVIQPIPIDPRWEISFESGTFDPYTFEGEVSNVVFLYSGEAVIKVSELSIDTNGVPESTNFVVGRLHAKNISTFNGVFVADELAIKDTGVGVLLDAFQAINKQKTGHIFSRNIRFFLDLVTIGVVQIKGLTIQHEDEYLQVGGISVSQVRDGMLGRFSVEGVRGVGEGGVIYQMDRLELKKLPFSSAATNIKSYENVYCVVVGASVAVPELSVSLGGLTLGPLVRRGANSRFPVDLRQLSFSPGSAANAEIRALFRDVGGRRVTLDNRINMEVKEKADQVVARLTGTVHGGAMADVGLLVEVGVLKKTFNRLFEEFLPAVLEDSMNQDDISALVEDLLAQSEFRKAEFSLNNRELVDVLFSAAARDEKVSERELRTQARTAVKKANQETRGPRASADSINNFLSRPGKLVVSLKPKQPISFDAVAVAGKTPSLLRYMLNIDIRFIPSGEVIAKTDSQRVESEADDVQVKPEIVWKSDTDIRKSAVHPLPPNGDLRMYGSGERLGSLEIKTSEGAHFLIKLVNPASSETVAELFVHADSIIKVRVPLGSYELRYATGESWHGRQQLFGPETGYFRADKLFDFTKKGNRVTGYSVKLFRVRGGNLPTSRINPQKF